MMNLLLLRKLLPYILYTSLAAGAYYFIWNQGGNHVRAKWDKAVAEQVATQLLKNQEDTAKIKKLEETKNENITELDRLRANNHALWLRLPKTPCSGSGKASSDSTTASGKLPTKSESDLAEAKRQLDDEARRADGVVESCRVLNELIK